MGSPKSVLKFFQTILPLTRWGGGRGEGGRGGGGEWGQGGEWGGVGHLVDKVGTKDPPLAHRLEKKLSPNVWQKILYSRRKESYNQSPWWHIWWPKLELRTPLPHPLPPPSTLPHADQRRAHAMHILNRKQRETQQNVNQTFNTANTFHIELDISQFSLQTCHRCHRHHIIESHSLTYHTLPCHTQEFGLP